MKINLKSFVRKIGEPPGTLISKEVSKVFTSKVSLITYNNEVVNEYQIKEIAELESYVQEGLNIWVHVDGIHDPAIIRAIGEQFGIDGLVLEDIMNAEHRPKIEVYDDYLFITLKSLTFNQKIHEILATQHSYILLNSVVISFSENDNVLYNPLRKRFKSDKSKVRQEGSDYLLYALMDIVVDHYYMLADQLGDELETLEEDIFNDPSDQALQKIHLMKNDILLLRKAINPLKEIINKIYKTEDDFIKPHIISYYSDVYDHALHVIDVVDTFRDISTSLKDLYLSSVSTRMNKVMQVLTVIATIFIPLTFIAGIYGMNFDFMPELHWKYGYFAVWGVMLIVVTIMLLFFRRKKWL